MDGQEQSRLLLLPKEVQSQIVARLTGHTQARAMLRLACRAMRTLADAAAVAAAVGRKGAGAAGHRAFAAAAAGGRWPGLMRLALEDVGGDAEGAAAVIEMCAALAR